MSDKFPKTSKSSEPQNESRNNPLPSWSSNMQAYITPQSAPAGLYSYPSGMLSQGWSRPLQFNSLHDPRRLSNYHMVSEGSSALSFSEKLLRVYGGKNLDSVEKSDENLQPKILVTNVSEENKKTASTPEINCAASEINESQHEGQDDNSVYNRSTKIVLQNYPLTKKQKCNMILGNGQVAQKKTDPENCNVVDKNKMRASQANSTDLLNQNLGTAINASNTNPQLEKESLRKKERKREQNRESSKRRKMRIEQENEELRKRVENLRDEVSGLKKELLCISEQSEEVQKENDSLVKELIEKYGEESIADLINIKPAAP